jgi:lysine 6-dehydrogenase
MKVLVLGAGMMGSAVVFDLAKSDLVESITVADADSARARTVSEKTGGSKTKAAAVDVRNHSDVVELMKGCDVAISAVTLYHNDTLTKAAIEARKHFCDLGGSDEILRRQKTLDSDAKRAGVVIVPNCGLAPGTANVIAMYGVNKFDRVQSVKIRVGGLPERPKPPLNYQLVFSVEGLLKEYTERAKVLRVGKVEYVDPLSEVEPVEIPGFDKSLEAFHTSGGASLLPDLLQGKVDSLDYKTIRYRGHAEKMKTLLDLGFANTDPISIGDHIATPRELFGELLKKKLSFGDKDVVLMKVEVQGVRESKEKTVTFTMIDRYDEQTLQTAMMRTTAYPVSIIAQMIGRGEISSKGVPTPEECVPTGRFIEELSRRSIVINETWN